MNARLHAIGNTLAQRWCWSLLLTLMLIVLIYLAGPMVAINEHKILAGVSTRILVSGCLLLAWALIMLLLQRRDQRRQLSDEQRDDLHQEQQLKKQAKDELGIIKDRMQQALQVIRDSSFYGKRGDRFRYELPWYLLLGATGSGKTSLLEHSGVEFPVNEQKDSLTHDIGHTRYCDWYFANHAILIDSAGRFTEQQGSGPDADIWQGFLRQLKLRRRRRPLNGVLLTLDLDQLLQDSEADLERYARTIRERMQELHSKLTIGLPVYLVLTKTDRLPGFREFFDALSREERDQVMGITFKESTEGTQASVLKQEFEELLRRLNSQVLQRVHQERDVARRGQLLEFPMQLAGIGERLALFVELAFGKTRYHNASQLRGVYFTSAPELEPNLDEDTAAIGRNLGLPRHLLPTTGANRGLFIRRLLEEVIFPEAELAGLDKRYENKLKWRNRLAYATALAVLVLGGGLWANSFLYNTERQHEMAARLEQGHDIQRQLPSVAGLSETAPLLNTLLDASRVYPADDQLSWTEQLGLYQGTLLNQMSSQIYDQQLREQLLPRIRRQLEEQIAANLDNRNVLSNALRAYLMLNMQRHLDPDFLKEWVGMDWSYRYSGQGQLQQQLTDHFDHLLKIGFDPVKLDKKLLISARNELRTEPTAELVYRMLQEDPSLVNVADFTFASALTSYPRVFDYDDYRIPALYTRDGYQRVFLARGIGLVKDIVDNNWVLGDSTELSEFEIRRIYSEVEEMYFRDYTEHWNTALNQLQIKSSTSLAEASAQLQAMTTGSRPILEVLQAVRKHSLLLDNAPQVAETAGELSGKLAKKADPKMRKLVASGVESALAEADANSARQTLARQFHELNVLLPDGQTPAPALQNAMDALFAVQSRFNAVANAPDPGQAAYKLARQRMNGDVDELGRLRQAMDNLPSPASHWLLQVADQGWFLMLSSTHNYIQQQYAAELWRPYRNSIAGRYPFDQQAEQEVALGDFNAFFGKGGNVDGFYSNVLRPFVSGNRGRLYARQVDGQGLPLSGSFLRQMSQAHVIQQSFFSENDSQAQLQFKMEPLALSSSLLKSELKLDGSSLVYEHGPIIGKQFTWPGTASRNLASIALHNLAGNHVLSRQSTGTWSLFRLLDEFQVESQTGSNVLKASLNKEGLTAQYLIASRHSPNPLNRQTLVAFGLPAKL